MDQVAPAQPSTATDHCDSGRSGIGSRPHREQENAPATWQARSCLLEPAKRLELLTCRLRIDCSTTELRWLVINSDHAGSCRQVDRPLLALISLSAVVGGDNCALKPQYEPRTHAFLIVSPPSTGNVTPVMY